MSGLSELAGYPFNTFVIPLNEFVQPDYISAGMTTLRFSSCASRIELAPPAGSV